MKTILERVRREPALLLGLIGTTISLLLAFGLHLTDEQVGAIMAVVVSALALVTRQAVTPNVSVALRKDEVTEGADVAYLGERGAFDASILVTLACIVVILVGVVWLAQAL